MACISNISFLLATLLALSWYSVNCSMQQYFKTIVPTKEDDGIVNVRVKDGMPTSWILSSSLEESKSADNSKKPVERQSRGKEKRKQQPMEKVTITSANFLKRLDYASYPRYLLNSGHKKKRGNCDQSVYLSPNDRKIKFSLSDFVHKAKYKDCSWSFRGVEGCRAVLSCDSINLTKSCGTEYMEVVDGSSGLLRICGGNLDNFENVTASGKLRDLYVRYHANNESFPKSTGNKLFKCWASCSTPEQSLNPLEKQTDLKINPKCHCGTKPKQDRVIGGQLTTSGNHPWLASLVDTNTRQTLCGGSILNSKYILTAGHCISRHWMDYSSVQVVLHGEQFDPVPPRVNFERPDPKTYPLEILQQLDEGNRSLRFNVAEMTIHPYYIIKRHDFDVALIKIDGEINFVTSVAPDGGRKRTLVSPICLPELGDYATSYSGKTGHISGWGMTTTEKEAWSSAHLREATVNVMSPEECVDLNWQSYEKKLVKHRVICAGVLEGGVDTCQGDSGGPLVIEEEKNKIWRQIGVTSWGQGCGEAGFPGVYFRTSEIVQWIHYVTNYDYRKNIGDEDAATWCLSQQ